MEQPIVGEELLELLGEFGQHHGPDTTNDNFSISDTVSTQVQRTEPINPYQYVPEQAFDWIPDPKPPTKPPRDVPTTPPPPVPELFVPELPLTPFNDGVWPTPPPPPTFPEPIFDRLKFEFEPKCGDIDPETGKEIKCPKETLFIKWFDAS